MRYNIARKVGIELEVAESERTRAMPPKDKYWLKKGDGSISGIGAEFVFKEPLAGNDVVDAVNNICFWFKHRTPKNPKPYPKKDWPAAGIRNCWFRTEHVNNGFHLHIDYNGVDDEQTMNFLDCGHFLYENIIKTVDRSRRGNGYCLPYDRLPSQMIRLYGNGSRNFLSVSRYMFLNPTNLYNRDGKRTIEVRLHEGTGDKDKILTWTEFWVTLANLCDNKRITPKFIHDVGFAGVLDRMTLSEKTKERFLKCV